MCHSAHWKPGDNFVEFSPPFTWVLGIKLHLPGCKASECLLPIEPSHRPQGNGLLICLVELKFPSFGLHLFNCKVRIISCTVYTFEVFLTVSSGCPFLPRSDFSSHPMSLMSLKKQRTLFRD